MRDDVFQKPFGVDSTLHEIRYPAKWIKIKDRRYNFVLIQDYLLNFDRGQWSIVLNSGRKTWTIHCDSEEDAKHEMKRLDDLLDVQ